MGVLTATAVVAAMGDPAAFRSGREFAAWLGLVPRHEGTVVTDGLPSYRAAMTVIGNAAARTCGRWLNNRAENSHQPFRRREAAMANFRDVKTLQKFASVHASIHNHFNHERHLNRREIFKRARAAALAEWRQLAA